MRRAGFRGLEILLQSRASKAWVEYWPQRATELLGPQRVRRFLWRGRLRWHFVEYCPRLGHGLLQCYCTTLDSWDQASTTSPGSGQLLFCPTSHQQVVERKGPCGLLSGCAVRVRAQGRRPRFDQKRPNRSLTSEILSHIPSLTAAPGPALAA